MKRAVCIPAILWLLLIAASSQAAETPAAAWDIGSVAVPSNFKPGGDAPQLYEVTIANSGGGATDGSEIILTDELPAGLEALDVELWVRSDKPGGGPGRVFDYGSSACETESTGATETVRCVVSNALPEAIAPTSMHPSESLRMVVYVSVPPDLSGPLLNRVQVSGGAPTAAATSENLASPVPAPAGLSAYKAAVSRANGEPATQAASHPYAYTTRFAVNTEPAATGSSAPFVPAGGNIKDIRIALPPGLAGNTTAVSRCTRQEFFARHSINVEGTDVFQNDCPDGSAVGLIVIQQREGIGQILPIPLYNLVPPKGMPAQFGFQLAGAPIYIDTELRTGGDYGVTAWVRNTSEARLVTAATATIWGTPANDRHDRIRGACLSTTSNFSIGSCPAGISPMPFLRLPTSCDSPLVFAMDYNTWLSPAAFAGATDNRPSPTGCAALDFAPTISSRPQVTTADSPSGLTFNLHLPQNEDGDALATADLRDVVVTLPPGVSVNPASAAGLVACSPAQIDLNGAGPARCPDAAKIGSVEVDTPLLDHPVMGATYVASQGENPFNSLIAIYIAAHDPETGVVLKLAGKVTLDPVSGQVETTFTDNPQLPFEDLTTVFFNGPRAPLLTPLTCGTYATTTSLRPWSAPDSGPAVTPSDSFAVTAALDGRACAASEAQAPHEPTFSAGTQIPLAGHYSTFVTRLSRGDGSQRLGGLSIALPPGLVGKLAGTPYCAEAQLAAAAARSGKEEQAAPSCPVASRVGSVDVGAGAGSSPLHVQGQAYLTGPYKDGQLGLAVITPAVAGPFDLGTVVVRTALRVNPVSTQVSAVSDPFPAILQGIPLDLRSILVALDKPEFTLNPTSCEPSAVTGVGISLTGQYAPLSSRFQIGGCRGLGFSPRLATSLFGGTRRGAHPKLRVVVSPLRGDANIRRSVVALPRSEFLDQSHIKTICTRVQFAADKCPSGSVYGRATAFTPLLAEPLKGPVYLRSSNHKLPDLVVALRGQIEAELSGRIDSVRGGIRASFDAVPDVPVSKFVLEMRGGEKGLLVNSRDVCAQTYRSLATFTGQNGRRAKLRPPLKNSKCG